MIILMGKYPKYFVDKLKNNLKIVTVPISKSSIINISIFINAGYGDENGKNVGVAHFLEHLIATDLREGELANKYFNNGIYFSANASTSTYRTIYYVTGDAKHGNKLLDLMLSIYLNRRIDTNIIDRERNAIVVEMMSKSHSKEQQMSSIILPKLLFGTKNHVIRDADLHVKNIYNITPNNLSKFMEDFYQPANTVIVISGNFERKQMISNITEQLDKIPNKAVKLTRELSYNIGAKPKCYFMKDNRNINTVVISFYAFKSHDYKNKYYSYYLSKILSGIGSRSILFQELRVKLGLTYSPNISISVTKYYGTFDIVFNGKNEHIHKIMAQLINILIHIKTKLLDNNFFSLVRSKYTLNVREHYDNISPNAFSYYGNKILNKETIFTPLEIYDKFHKKTTPHNILNTAKKLFVKERANMVILGKDDKKIEKVLLNLLNKL